MKTKHWVPLVIPLLLSIATASTAADKPAPFKMQPALVVMDIQNEYLPMMDGKDVKRGMEVINYIIDLFRENGFPVIRVYHTELGVGPKPGTPGFEFPKSVHIKNNDPKIIKNYGNAFKKTDLDKLLRDKGINTVFLVGLSSVGCVLATYQGALDFDYQAFMVKDALISHDATLTKYVQDITQTINYSALRLLLETARAR